MLQATSNNTATVQDQKEFSYYGKPYKIVPIADYVGYVSIGKNSIEKITYTYSADTVELKEVTNLGNSLTDKQISKLKSEIQQHLSR